MDNLTINGKPVITSPQLPGDLLIPDLNDDYIFYRIDSHFIHDQRLSHNAKLVYCKLLSLGKQRNHDATLIAAWSGLTVPDTVDAIIELDECGYDVSYARGW